MKFITLNRHDIVTSSYVDGRRYIDFHSKQVPITINTDKIISMGEYFDDDGKFIYTTINIEGTLSYDVTCRIEDIVKLINCEENEIKQVSIVGTVMTV